MKKLLYILLIIPILISGCSKEEKKEDLKIEKDTKEEIIEEKEVYKDLNNTPIGLYKLEGNKLVRLNTFNTKLIVEQDISTFQIFPSNEEVIYLDKAFGQAYHDEWYKYNTDNNIKLGFNIKFNLSNGEHISYNMFNPSNTFDKWEYLMNYMYDDYINMGKGFYSHIEENEYNENTLVTSLKLQSSYYSGDINSKIELTVFTYDTEDDFDNNEYRGNSKYTLNICVDGFSCE